MTRVLLTAFETALGPMAVATTEQGVVATSLPPGGAARVRRELARLVPGAAIVEAAAPLPEDHPHAALVAQTQAFLRGETSGLDAPLDLRGTPFQRACWDALRAIPYGTTISYAELARRVGRPGASRAVGQANGANPVPLFVPCHRVVAADGSLGGFGGGPALKRALLALERRGAGAASGASS